MGEFVEVIKKADLEEGKGMVVEVGDKKVALFNVGGEFHAIDNLCPHKQGPLGEGMLDGDNVACPWHGWVFSVKNGVSPVNPATKVVKYNVKIEEDNVLIEKQ
ncbi:MAG: Rieske (2Fe-2S) protein [Candidatus Aenigmatarchaeota archaeon]